MKRLVVKMEDELHRAVKLKVLMHSISEKQFVIETVQKELNKEEVSVVNVNDRKVYEIIRK